ncbi:MAG: hypothetical protein DMG22_04735 [Acidobacteria bacterium]|nr:MAG: hypothetical protein DMG22_04735 [Acidobacteriota bacterium]
MLSPFAIPLRTALSAAKGLRVNFAKHPYSVGEKTAKGFFASLRMTTKGPPRLISKSSGRGRAQRSQLFRI